MKADIVLSICPTYWHEKVTDTYSTIAFVPYYWSDTDSHRKYSFAIKFYCQ